MSIVNWSDEFVTGDAAVDKQHRALFNIINALHETIVAGRTKEIMSEILDTLERYVGKHFAAEQQLMQSAEYPSMQQHIRQHQELATRATEIIQQHRQGELVLGITVSRFLSRWLTEHILVDDKKLVQ
jgi:hemerythrin-like metal-binding protein